MLPFMNYMKHCARNGTFFCCCVASSSSSAELRPFCPDAETFRVTDSELCAFLKFLRCCHTTASHPGTETSATAWLTAIVHVVITRVFPFLLRHVTSRFYLTSGQNGRATANRLVSAGQTSIRTRPGGKTALWLGRVASPFVLRSSLCSDGRSAVLGAAVPPMHSAGAVLKKRGSLDEAFLSKIPVLPNADTLLQDKRKYNLLIEL